MMAGGFVTPGGGLSVDGGVSVGGGIRDCGGGRRIPGVGGGGMICVGGVGGVGSGGGIRDCGGGRRIPGVSDGFTLGSLGVFILFISLSLAYNFPSTWLMLKIEKYFKAKSVQSH
jgi:hypothetical protein